MAELELDNSRLRNHLASDSAIRELLGKIEDLEKEKKELIHRSVAIAAESGEFSARQAEVENELARLASLFVATTQLHGAATVPHVLRVLKELLSQLLGAGAFAIYLVSDDGHDLVALASEGVPAKAVARQPVGAGPVGRVVTRGEIYTQLADDTSRGTLEAPAAVVPLRLEAEVVGAIAIFKTLPQKTEFGGADDELLRLLGAQAAPALVRARLFTDVGRKLPSIQAFFDLED
jgi:hypothetical protein